MNKKLKATAILAISALVFTGMAGCGKGSGADQAYGARYLEKIGELQEEGLADQFALANIDEDEVPELIASDSLGSYDHENAFIFTIRNGEVTELAGVIAGVDGGNLAYSEGANIVHVSGAAAGMRDVFYRLHDGELEEVFTAEATSMDDDARYSINGSTVEENGYYEQIGEFIKTYCPLTRITCDGLVETNYVPEDGYFEQGGSAPYPSVEEIKEELGR